MFFDCLVWRKNEIFAHGKAVKQNWCGGKILYGWCPNSVLHLPAKNYKCRFKFANIIVKNRRLGHSVCVLAWILSKFQRVGLPSWRAQPVCWLCLSWCKTATLHAVRSCNDYIIFQFTIRHTHLELAIQHWWAGLQQTGNNNNLNYNAYSVEEISNERCGSNMCTIFTHRIFIQIRFT